jgi:indole-3-glycerol phosphate synthase
VTDARRLSQAISEGDGISVIVHVDSVEDARRAEDQGAEGLAILHGVDGIGDATALPVLWLGPVSAAEEIARCRAHAVAVWVAADGRRVRRLRDETGHAVELVIGVANEEELEQALGLDPEIFLIATRGSGAEAQVERAIELLPDVPAGRLAIAQLADATRDEVEALERAGYDAVLVPPGFVGDLVGGPPPEV